MIMIICNELFFYSFLLDKSFFISICGSIRNGQNLIGCVIFEQFRMFGNFIITCAHQSVYRNVG